MDGMSGYQEKSRRARGIAACLLALALACVLPAETAHAEYFPEGKGEFDISVATEVVPTVDADAELCDVIVHVANDAGEHLGDAQVEIVVAPPNAAEYDPAGQPQALDEIADDCVLSASGSTSCDGRVLVPSAVVGATYQVEAIKDGHKSFEGLFTCSGVDNEVWEVTLERILAPLPPGSTNAGATAGAGDEASSAAVPEAVRAAWYEFAGEGSEATGTVDASDPDARPVRGFMTLLADAFPYWLIIVGVLAAALATGLAWSARRTGKEDAAHEERA